MFGKPVVDLRRFYCWLIEVVVVVNCALAAGAGRPVGPVVRVVGHSSENTLVEPDAATLAQLHDGADHVHVQAMPLADGSTADLELDRVEVFRSGSRIYAFDGKSTSAITGTLPIMYRGHNPLDPSQVAFISVSSDDEIRALVADREKITLLAPEAPGNSSHRHVLSKGDPKVLADFRCGEDALIDSGSQLVNTSISGTFTSPTAELALTNLREAQLFIDVSHSLLTQGFSSNQTNARNYVANLIGAVSTIYQRDLGVALSVSQLVVWTGTDPFGTSDLNTQLTNYKAYNIANRSGAPRTACHLLSYAPGLGGIGYVGTLCNTSAEYAVSNLHADSTFPVNGYQWDVFVVAHELGHNFGSPHTHCYDPPIDCCVNQASCNMCPVVTAQVGTIMSYCHMNGSITLNFHPRCIAVIQDTVARVGCLPLYVPPVPPAPPAPQLSSNLSGFWGSGLTDSPVQIVKSTSTGASYRLKATLYVQNTGSTPNNKLLDTSDIYLSSDASLDPSDALVYTRKIGAVIPQVEGKPPKYRKLKLKIPLSQSATGKHLIALIHSTSDVNPADNGAVSAAIP